ncbi:ankyrin repeat domain-containing protein [Azospirillum sp. B510]|uniref:ankyrin repeat domain-containing protein n=1 Tax=Azospirillum sp. (strain B510) TaxID=137722 RepID=UPI000311BF1B|nr:ankyrin repeat domain-containing protein [Azospirillum sp. B510]
MDRSAPNQSSRARRAAPGHHDPATNPGRGSVGATAVESRDGLVLAFLARKRLLVLVGDAGSGRPALFRQLVDHVAADGAMALPVMASVGAELEDLIGAAGSGALPDLAVGENGGEDGVEVDFDGLITALEERLELAGSGLLAVDNAAVLAPPVLADLVELTRAETPSGRFLQVLLCGTPELEGTLARAGLADALRDTGVIYRLAPGGGGADDAREAPRPAPVMAVPLQTPPANDRPAGRWQDQEEERWSEREAATVTAPDMAHPDGGRGHGDHGTVGHGTFDQDFDRGPEPGMRAPRRAALLAGAALTTLVLLGAAGAAILTAMPGGTTDRALSMIEDGWSHTRDAVERTLRDVTGGKAPVAGRQAADTPPASAAPVGQPVAPQATAVNTRTVATAATSPAVPAISPATAPVAAAPVETAPQPQPQPLAAAKPAASPGNTEAAPGVASLPPLEDPSASAALPAAPRAAVPDADTLQRVRAMADQARRQIAGKRLTTPPGDNAYETVQRIRQIAPSAPEAAELLTAMTDIYRRWAMQAERDGDWSETKRFYERAQMIMPDSADLAERIRAASEQRVYEGPSGGASTGTGAGAPAAPVKATPGLGDRDSVLALLRNPADLSRALQAGASADTRVDSGKTLLMLAAEQGLPDAVRVLLDRHARTDLRTSDGATAVMYAAWEGHDAVVRALADGGADLDTTNSDGKTALMAAAARGHEDVARTLIQRGVMVDRATAFGWSALMYAANNGHEAVAKLLLDSGANPYRMDANGNSALTLGALQGHVQVVEALKPR